MFVFLDTKFKVNIVLVKVFYLVCPRLRWRLRPLTSSAQGEEEANAQ